MRRLIVLAAVLTLLPFGKFFAQAPAKTAPHSIFGKTDTNSLLWEISGKGIEQPSFVYGTIHIIPEKDYFMTAAAEEAFEASKEVVFEIDMNEMTNPMAQMQIMMKAMMPGEKTLNELLSAEDYLFVKKHFESNGMPMMMVDRLKPFFSSVLASMDLGDMGMMGGMNPVDDEAEGTEEKEGMVSYEMKFMEMAKASDKAIGGLETIDFQISIFDSIPLEQQATMLVEAIKTKDIEQEGDAQLDRMIALYKAQDIEGMVAMMNEEGQELMEFDDLILNDRNANWIAPMKEKMAVQPTFFAVGAGHLGGEKGVLALLRKEGYQVRPLK